MRISVQLDGSVRSQFGLARLRLAEQMTAAMTAATEAMKRDMRATISSAGLGRRLGLAFGSRIYPRARNSIRPAGEIFPRGSSAERIILGFTTGATIRGRSGNWLAIPIKENLPVLPRATKPTPDNVARAIGIAEWTWRVPRRGRLGLLVATGVRRGRGRSRRVKVLSRSRRARIRVAEEIPMFYLVRQVTVQKRLSLDGVAQRGRDELVRRIGAIEL